MNTRRQTLIRRATIATGLGLVLSLAGFGYWTKYTKDHRTTGEVTYSSTPDGRVCFYHIKDIDGIESVGFYREGKEVYRLSVPQHQTTAEERSFFMLNRLPLDDWTFDGEKPIQVSGSAGFDETCDIEADSVVVKDRKGDRTTLQVEKPLIRWAESPPDYQDR